MKKLISIILLGTASMSYAGTGLDCKNVDNLEDNEVSACLEQTDSWLNSSYKQLMTTYKNLPQVAKDLKQAQKDWLKFRDSHCNMIFTLGSASSAKQRTLDACLTKITLDRVNQLDALKE